VLLCGFSGVYEGLWRACLRCVDFFWSTVLSWF